MAFSKGTETIDNKQTEFSRYTGVGYFKLLKTNPTLDEINAIYGSQREDAPQYIKTEEDFDGNKKITARIDFHMVAVLETTVLRSGKRITVKQPETKQRFTFFIENSVRYNRDKTKIQVIDRFGRTTWVTVEQAKNHEIPVTSNGNPFKIDKDYRPAYIGEEALTRFLIAYLNIQSCEMYDEETQSFKMRPENELANCEARLENVKDLFTGKFDEIKSIEGFQPDNLVGVLLGVQEKEGKDYQKFFNKEFLKGWSGNFKNLQRELDNSKQAGAYGDTNFEMDFIKEFSVKPTEFIVQNEDESVTPLSWNIDVQKENTGTDLLF